MWECKFTYTYHKAYIYKDYSLSNKFKFITYLIKKSRWFMFKLLRLLQMDIMLGKI